MPTANLTPNGDQRVTNAAILAEIKIIRRDMDKIGTCIDQIDARQRGDHDQMKANASMLADNTDEINRLRTKSDFWNFGNTVLASIAGLIGYNK